MGDEPMSDVGYWESMSDPRPMADPDHDDDCESEFIPGPNAWSPCGCAERRGA